MKSTWVLAVLLFASPAVVQAAEPPPRPPDPEKPAPRPNIVFILADDVGLGNVSCYGGHFQTPHIDALAHGGLRFARCYASPLCGPSRATLMTGRYAFRTGMVSNSSAASDHRDEIMTPRVLKLAGYATALVGKWSDNWLEPSDWGFDEYLRTKGGGKYWSSQVRSYSQTGVETPLGERYLPDVMHDFLVDFMTRRRDQPFYVMYSLAQMHATLQRTPDSPPDGAGVAADLYADNNAYMDKLVGRLTEAVDRLGLRERTLIVFTSDNGTSKDGAARATVGGRPIVGQKGGMQEGGSRVPLIVRWPGVTPACRVLPDLVDFSDFLPTLAELAGPKLAGVQRHIVPIDGRSLAAQIQGRTGSSREWIFVQLEDKWYVRSSHWKLTGEGALFDMKDAPFQELAVSDRSADPEAQAARKSLQAVLDKLTPNRVP